MDGFDGSGVIVQAGCDSNALRNSAASTAFLSNQSTGQYTTVTFNSPYYDGSSADFVYEKRIDHANWGSTAFSNCMLS